MDLTALWTATRNRVGISSTDARAGDTAVTELIVEALNAIATERDWPWLETSETFSTVNGTATRAVPTGWMRTRTLQVAGSAPMDDSRSREQLDGLWSDSTATGQPMFFVVSGDALRMYPTPDAVYSVTHVYYRQETQLSSGSDTPLMPAWAHAAIAEWASSLLLTRLREDARAEAAMKRAHGWLDRLQDNARRVTGPVRVRVRPGGFV